MQKNIRKCSLFFGMIERNLNLEKNLFIEYQICTHTFIRCIWNLVVADSKSKIKGDYNGKG